MRKESLMLVCLFFLGSAAVNADAATVLDAPSCAQWNPNEVAHVIWIEAFLSGIAVERNEDFLDKISLKKIVQWVNNYCKDNPRGEVTVAGVQLSLELTRQNKSSIH